jgi:hypothetical protein
MWLKPPAHMQHARRVPYKVTMAIAHRLPAWLNEDQQLCVGEEALRGPRALPAAVEPCHLTKACTEMSKTKPTSVCSRFQQQWKRCQRDTSVCLHKGGAWGASCVPASADWGVANRCASMDAQAQRGASGRALQRVSALGIGLVRGPTCRGQQTARDADV